jgi:hypothetical protein
MKHFATLVAAAPLMLNLGVEAVYALNESVKMTFSGTSENTAINLHNPIPRRLRKASTPESESLPLLTRIL